MVKLSPEAFKVTHFTGKIALYLVQFETHERITTAPDLAAKGKKCISLPAAIPVPRERFVYRPLDGAGFIVQPELYSEMLSKA